MRRSVTRYAVTQPSPARYVSGRMPQLDHMRVGSARLMTFLDRIRRNTSFIPNVLMDKKLPNSLWRGIFEELLSSARL